MKVEGIIMLMLRVAAARTPVRNPCGGLLRSAECGRLFHDGGLSVFVLMPDGQAGVISTKPRRLESAHE
jgi:hypothetical protein